MRLTFGRILRIHGPASWTTTKPAKTGYVVIYLAATFINHGFCVYNDICGLHIGLEPRVYFGGHGR